MVRSIWLKNIVLASIAMAILVGTTTPAQAYRFGLGFRFGYEFEFEKLGIGPDIKIPFGRIPLVFNPSWEWYLDAGSLWQLNADFQWEFRLRKGRRARGILTPVVGAGFLFAHQGDGAKRNALGLNILGGLDVRIPRTGLVFFGQGRGSFRFGDDFGHGFGLIFGVRYHF